MNKPIFVIVCGCSGSGKTTFSERIAKMLPKKLKSIIISQDDFYLPSHKIPKLDDLNNYDHPNAFDWKQIKQVINDLLISHKPVKIKKYDFTNSMSSKKIYTVDKVDVVIFEGLYSLYDKSLIEQADLRLFVDAQLDECLIRRILRDVHERNRTIDSIIKQWRLVVKPMYKAYIEPLKVNADIIIPWNNFKENPIELISNGILAKL